MIDKSEAEVTVAVLNNKKYQKLYTVNMTHSDKRGTNSLLGFLVTRRMMWP